MDAYVSAGIPTLAIGLAVWGLRSWFEEIRATLRALNDKVGGHGEKLSGHDARIVALESEKERVKDRLHELSNAVTSAAVRRGRR